MEYDYRVQTFQKGQNQLTAIIILVSIVLIGSFLLVINDFAAKVMFKPMETLVKSINTIAEGGDLTLP